MDTNVNIVEDSGQIEALQALWLFFWFNRFFGVCPILRSGHTLVYKYLHFYWIPVLIGISGSIMIIKVYLYPLICVPGTKVMPVLRDVTYSAHALWNILYMAWFARKLPKFIEKCGNFEKNVLAKYKSSSKSKDTDKKSFLVRDSYFLIVLIVIVLSAEYFFYLVYAWFETLKYFKDKGLYTEWGLYYYFGLYAKLFQGNDFNFVKGLFLCLFDMFSYVSWFFADTFLILSSLIFASYLERYNDSLEEKTQDLMPIKKFEGYRRDFRKITKMIEEFNRDFANLFVLTYIGNVVYLFCKLYVGLAHNFQDGDHFMVKFHVIFRVTVIGLKIFLPTWICAGIHEQTKRTLEIVQDAPTEPDCPNPTRLHLVEQFVRQLTVRDIGISCHGFFTITKAFCVLLVSAFITYEMVVLEFISTKVDTQVKGVYFSTGPSHILHLEHFNPFPIVNSTQSQINFNFNPIAQESNDGINMNNLHERDVGDVGDYDDVSYDSNYTDIYREAYENRNMFLWPVGSQEKNISHDIVFRYVEYLKNELKRVLQNATYEYIIE